MSSDCWAVREPRKALDDLVRNLAWDYVWLETVHGRGNRHYVFKMQKRQLEQAALQSGALPGEFKVVGEMVCFDDFWVMVPRLC